MARKIQLAVVTAVLTTSYIDRDRLGQENGYGFQNLIVNDGGQTVSISFHHFV